MNYHNITKDDMNNGAGLRVVLWLAGCDHHCPGCQNPLTWNPNDGLPVGNAVYEELDRELSKDYIEGITLSGGDPLHPANRDGVFYLLAHVKKQFPDKNVWLYTGYTWEKIAANPSMRVVMGFVDVLVDGPFVEALKDVNYPWAGSTNQRVIDVQKSLREGKVILYDGDKEGRYTGTVRRREDQECC